MRVPHVLEGVVRKGADQANSIGAKILNFWNRFKHWKFKILAQTYLKIYIGPLWTQKFLVS